MQLNKLCHTNPVCSRQSSLATHMAQPCAMCGAAVSCMPNLFRSNDARMFDRIITGRRRVERNAILYRESDPFQMLYVVRAGQFKALRRDPAGSLRVVRFYMQGDLLGVDAINGKLHLGRVMALEDSEVCEISYANVQKLIANDSQFADRFLQEMSHVLATHYENTLLLALPSLDMRFATFLLSLGARHAALGYSERIFRLSMSRSDIGSYIGATVETVSRLISRFNAQRLVTIRGRMVELLDRAALIALLDGDNVAVASPPTPLPPHSATRRPA